MAYRKIFANELIDASFKEVKQYLEKQVLPYTATTYEFIDLQLNSNLIVVENDRRENNYYIYDYKNHEQYIEIKVYM